MRIAILTCFNDLHPGYSLASVVINQCRMLERMGHQVDLLVHTQWKNKHPVPEGINVRPIIPWCHQKDYEYEKDLTEDHKKFVDDLALVLATELPQYQMVLTQDWFFTGWFMPYNLALYKVIETTKNTLFLHFIHSVPPRCKKDQFGNKYDWRDMNRMNKFNNHKLVSFTQHNKHLIEYWWNAKPEEVVIIPHILDTRVENQFCQETWDLIDAMPNILQGDVVCVFPASCDRLRPKQIQVAIGIFDGFKRRNMRVALVCANQWATGRVPKESIEKYKQFATTLGLRYGEEFVFTSDFDPPKYETGISKKMLNDLYKCANLFIFPTLEESYGLVGLEGAINGQYLVINDDVGCFKEIYGDYVQYEPFGSIEHSQFYGWTPDQVAEFLDEVSQRILEGMFKDKTCMIKTRIKRENNMDRIYLSFYEGLIKSWESRNG